MKSNLTIAQFVNLKRELSNRSNLDFVDTTSSSNGYPSDTSQAIVGFSTLEAAQNFAKKYGFETVLLHARDGWNFWARVSRGLYKELSGVRGGKRMSISEDTHNYIIGVCCIN
jgi:hypothetical protein